MIADIELPDDLIQFLRQGKQLEYERSQAAPGRIALYDLGQHILTEAYVDSENHPFAYSDPHAGEDGYYPVPAVGLVSACEYFDPPDSILMWLPEWKLFATWDDDHWDLRVFPHITWSQIAANPLPYINAIWQPENVENELFVPWLAYPHKHEFKRGRPWEAAADL
jgi:hypothetical protein